MNIGVIVKNVIRGWGIPTKLKISRLLHIIHYLNKYQIKAQKRNFSFIVKYTNFLNYILSVISVINKDIKIR